MAALPPILRQTIQTRLERFGNRLVRIPAEQLAAREAELTAYAAPVPNAAAPPDQTGECASRSTSQSETRPDKKETSEEYWTRVNVTDHKRFASAEESLDYFEWRNLLNSGYIESMPVAGHDGKAILDYVCGPGHDVVGFAHFSNLARVIAMDVSLAERGWRSTTTTSSSSASVRTTPGCPSRTRRPHPQFGRASIRPESARDAKGVQADRTLGRVRANYDLQPRFDLRAPRGPLHDDDRQQRVPGPLARGGVPAQHRRAGVARSAASIARPNG
jgi:hypothetical protein